jgi:hypothetical protein
MLMKKFEEEVANFEKAMNGEGFPAVVEAAVVMGRCELAAEIIFQSGEQSPEVVEKFDTLKGGFLAAVEAYKAWNQ